jgi:glycosyltransferase involved in cell wall biosynthesis
MISVCIATYNGEKYIKEQLYSILSQISKEDEIVISDDGSTDNTLNIISAFHDDRIRVYFNKTVNKLRSINLVTSNFENALNHVRGNIIFLSDQDDVWLENKVECSLKYLKKYDYIVSDCYITDQNLNIINNTRFYNGSGFTKNRWKALFAPTPYQGSCAAFHKKILKKALPFPMKIQSHDRWLGYVASFFYSYKIIPEPLILHRRHGNNTSTEISNEDISYKIKTRVRYIFELIKLAVKNV